MFEFTTTINGKTASAKFDSFDQLQAYVKRVQPQLDHRAPVNKSLAQRIRDFVGDGDKKPEAIADGKGENLPTALESATKEYEAKLKEYRAKSQQLDDEYDKEYKALQAKYDAEYQKINSGIDQAEEAFFKVGGKLKGRPSHRFADWLFDF